MADATVADPPPADVIHGDGLPIPPFDDTFLSECFPNADDPNDVVLDDLDFDFSFDDIYLPPFDENDEGAGFIPVSDDPNEQLTRIESFDPGNFQLDHHNSVVNGSVNAFKTTSSPDFPNSESPVSSNNSRVLNSTVSGDISSYLNVQSPENHRIAGDGDRSCDVAGYVNVASPESDGSNKACSEFNVLSCLSPVESQGSGNSRSNVSSRDSNKSVCSSPNLVKKSIRSGVVDQIKLEGYVKNENNVKVINIDSDSNKKCLLKRKKDSEYSDNNDGSDSNADSRTHKYRKSNSKSQSGGGNDSSLTEEDEKRKARLIRNRESAQLSRQRKKHYVEELEDKLRTLHSTVQDLNAKYSYVMAENATLRQQLAGGGAVPPPMTAPPPGMYPPPPMMYPWMPVPPYMVKPQGSKVPLVPIPRLKTQQPVSAPKTSKKAESKKNEGKTKKVASVSFLGLLFFVFLFGGLVPMLNVRYGARDAFMGGSGFVGNGLYEKHRGRVLNVDGSGFGEKFNGGPNFTSNVGCSRSGHNGGESNIKHGGDEFVRARNESEPLMASLYVPRNDKLVKIDGNLIIHSVLASEKAVASREVPEKKRSDETGLVVPRNIAPAVPVSGMGMNGGRHPHLALGYAEKENLKSPAADGRLQQWFREGLAGPMLSSGMCTEVFQFEVSPDSPPGGIIPATSARNVSADRTKNSTHVNKALNRRILHGVPIPLPGSSAHNVSENHTSERDSQNGNFSQTNSTSSMVVSVLFDPREAADSDGDDMIGSKSLSRIFVVVMIDSVKYVTYSCMLPFIKGTVPHLVAA